MDTPKVQLITVTVIFLLAISSGSPARAEAYGSGWYGELQVAYGHEDNISRSYKSVDQVSDEIASVTIGGGHSRKLGVSGQLILSGYVTQTTHDEFDDLDNLATSLGVDYTYAPNAGYDSVWYRIVSNATWFEYENSDPREGLLLDIDVSANKRFTPRLTGHLGYRYHDFRFVGKSSQEEDAHAAFDRDAGEVYAGLDFQVTQFVFLFGEYSFRQGDIVSTVSQDPTGAPPDAYDAQTLDPVFDDPCTRRCNFRYAYRQNGDVHLASVGVAFPLGIFNVDISGSYFESDGDNGKTYRDYLYKLGVLWNF